MSNVFLVGQQGTGWTELNTEPTATGNSMHGGLYMSVAGATLNMANAWFKSGAFVSAADFKVCVYTQAGALVAVSSPMACVSGWISAPISGSLLGATNYILVVVPSSGFYNYTYNSGSSAFGAYQMTAANFSYATPPSTLPGNTNSGYEFEIYIDGTITAGGGMNGSQMLTGVGT